MEKLALKVGGSVFILVAVLHALRVIMKVHVMIGDAYVPMRTSIVAGIIALALGVWMLKAGCCSCKK